MIRGSLARFAGYGCAIRAPRFKLAGQDRHPMLNRLELSRPEPSRYHKIGL